LLSLVVPSEGPRYIDEYLKKKKKDYIFCFRPRFLVRGHDWLHTCRTVGTIFQYRLWPGASSPATEPYSGYCCHRSSLLRRIV
jgi:hypothetical protein